MRRIQGELIHTNKFMQENLDKWRMSGKLGSERRIFSVPLDPHSVSFGESENQSQMLKGHLQYLIDSHSISWSHLCCLDLPLHPHSTPITSHSLVLSIPPFLSIFCCQTHQTRSLGGLLQSWNLLRLRGDPALRTTRDPRKTLQDYNDCMGRVTQVVTIWLGE